MNQKIVNGEYGLSWPDGFEVMSEEELKKRYLTNNPNCFGFGIQDKENHILVTLLWQKVSPAVLWILDNKTIAKRNEKVASKGYENHEYHLDAFFSRTISGISMEGYRFSYLLGEDRMQAESLLFKRKKYIYNLSSFLRKEDAAALHERADEVIRSIRAV